MANAYGVHRAWVHKLKARFEAEGETALELPLPATPDLTSRDPARDRPRPSSRSCGCARNSPKPATTPAPTRCSGT